MLHLTQSHSEGSYYYLIFNLVALLLGIAMTAIAARKSKIDVRELKVIVAAGILGAIVGSKLIMLTGTQWLSLLGDGHLPLDNSKSVVGAIIGGMLSAWSTGKFLGHKSSALDLCAVSLPLALAVQRLGCLLAGCCHGVITSMPWGITYGPGSKPYIEQQNLGLISADAHASLAMHPDQLYTVLAGITIALIVWKTRNYWKSSSSKFIFSVILLLAFRFVEEFTRFHLHPQEWMGIGMIQWKILVSIAILGLILFFREYTFANNISLSVSRPVAAMQQVKVFLIAVFILFTSVIIGGWLSADERTIVLLVVMPLCILLITVYIFRIILSPKYLHSLSLLVLACTLMSQKVDKPSLDSTPPPASYTAFNLTTGAGTFNNDHDFNYQRMNVPDCEGNNSLVETVDEVPYHHSYKIGGIGINRKIYYNQWRSLLAAFNVYAGFQKQTPLANQVVNYPLPNFSNGLISINPMLQYDMRGIGFGLGASLGLLGNDIDDKPADHSDYNPKTDARKASLQGRFRFFSERLSFIEVMGAYDLGSIADNNWQVLYGTRFNGHKNMLKAGIGGSRHGGNYFVAHGQIALSPRFYLSPQLMLSFNNNDYWYSKKGYRA
ncbi:MAG: prolipoprotein diacylglyceryl transferase, partial [Bacteroidota bacterium]|nr:prolipoprotein diacylglyceryl transferase [Bacteroidota bacterium]